MEEEYDYGLNTEEEESEEEEIIKENLRKKGGREYNTYTESEAEEDEKEKEKEKKKKRRRFRIYRSRRKTEEKERKKSNEEANTFKGRTRRRGRVLVIITGGTICMTNNGMNASLKTTRKVITNILMKNDEIMLGEEEEKKRTGGGGGDGKKKKKCMPYLKILEWRKLIDSADMNQKLWFYIANDIQNYYSFYDGFVVLHGTDTLAYTASALSFIFENLKKPVVLTGSMIPIGDVMTDAKRNMYASFLFAAYSKVPKVVVIFGSKIMLGNRTTKIDCFNVDAFDSPNCHPIGKLGINMEVALYSLLNPKEGEDAYEELQIAEKLCTNIGVFTLLPAIDVIPSLSYFIERHCGTNEQDSPSNNNYNNIHDDLCNNVHSHINKSNSDNNIYSDENNLNNNTNSVYTQKNSCNNTIANNDSNTNGANSNSTEGNNLTHPPNYSLSLKYSSSSASLLSSSSSSHSSFSSSPFYSFSLSSSFTSDSVVCKCAIILRLFGSGTAPSNKKFLQKIEDIARRRSVVVIALTQCMRGKVSLHTYENGSRLLRLGVLPAYDLTVEAAIGKVAYLLGKGYTKETLRKEFCKNLRGEITPEVD